MISINSEYNKLSIHETPTKPFFGSLGEETERNHLSQISPIVTPICNYQANQIGPTFTPKKSIPYNFSNINQSFSSSTSCYKKRVNEKDNTSSQAKKQQEDFDGDLKKNLFFVFEAIHQKRRKRNDKKKVTIRKSPFFTRRIQPIFFTSSLVLKRKNRVRKNKKQIDALNTFYQNSKKQKKKWSKEEIRQLSAKYGMSYCKVYKWLWDKNTKSKKFFTYSG